MSDDPHKLLDMARENQDLGDAFGDPDDYYTAARLYDKLDMPANADACRRRAEHYSSVRTNELSLDSPRERV